MSTFPVTLLEIPRQSFRHFHRAVIAAYGTECPNTYTHGLLGFIVSDAQWAQLPGNMVQPDDNSLPPVVLPCPTITVPPTPAINASSLTIKVWERRLADNNIHRQFAEIKVSSTRKHHSRRPCRVARPTLRVAQRNSTHHHEPRYHPTWYS